MHPLREMRAFYIARVDVLAIWIAANDRALETLFPTKPRLAPMNRNSQRTTHFLNVDLDIYSKSNLQPLVTAMGKKVHTLFVGRNKRVYQATLELVGAGLSKSPDSTIRTFCALIRSLPKTALMQWNAAKVRDFNIGVQAAMQPLSYRIGLAPETVRAASAVRARIVLTVYAPNVRRE